jgi:hypothetical protein
VQSYPGPHVCRSLSAYPQVIIQPTSREGRETSILHGFSRALKDERIFADLVGQTRRYGAGNGGRTRDVPKRP